VSILLLAAVSFFDEIKLPRRGLTKHYIAGGATPIKQMQRYLSFGGAGEVRQQREPLLLNHILQYGKTRSEFDKYPAAEGTS
jgi:hypothetical protein